MCSDCPRMLSILSLNNANFSSHHFIAPLPVYSKDDARNTRMKNTVGWMVELDTKDSSGGTHALLNCIRDFKELQPHI